MSRNISLLSGKKDDKNSLFGKISVSPTDASDSELAAEVLGESVFNFVLANKRNEWADYRSQVTPYEIEQNLKTL